MDISSLFKRVHCVFVGVILLLAAGCFKNKTQLACANGLEVTFLIQAPAEDSVVYLSGNNPNLGNWSGKGVAINMTNGKGQIVLCVDEITKLEFKVTAGSWEREAIYADGKVPGNFELRPLQDTLVEIKVDRWRDELKLDKSGMTGHFIEYPEMTFPGILARDVTVLLPPNYEQDKTSRYAVLYVHDGQNVFNPNSSTIGVDWGIDEWADSLTSTNAMEPVIVVAMNCTGDRYLDYSPGQKGEAYMNFVVHNVKPMIDSVYRTKSDRKHTAVMGASMGGLISFMMHWEHNDVFGKAACLSPAFVFENLDYTKEVRLGQNLEKQIDVFISNGNLGLEKELQLGCDRMMKTLDDAGYQYMWLHDLGAAHNEIAWNRLTGDILIWMFGN